MLDVFRPGLSWLSSALLAFQRALENGLGQGVMAGDVALPDQFPSLDRGQEWLLTASI